jgi:hypothetical protein
MRHAYGNANGDSNCRIHSDGDSNGNAYTKPDGNGNCDSNSNGDGAFANTDSDSNGDCDRTAAAYTDATSAADTAASTVIR